VPTEYNAGDFIEDYKPGRRTLRHMAALPLNQIASGFGYDLEQTAKNLLGEGIPNYEEIAELGEPSWKPFEKDNISNMIVLSLCKLSENAEEAAAFKENISKTPVRGE